MRLDARPGVLLAWLVLASACVEATRPSTGVPTFDEGGSDDFISVSVGRDHTCALTSDGSAHCWGSNEFGQLGHDDDGTSCRRQERDIPCQTRPVAVSGGLRFRKISAGGVHTCAIALDDRIYCWGDNLRGALGDPGIRRSHAPVPAVTASLFLDVAAGGEHSCGIRTDGVAMCWGANDRGQIGNGSTLSGFAVPTSLSPVLRYASIAAGNERTCARTGDGIGYCWGKTWVNRVGGVDVTQSQTTPQRVQTALAFRAVDVGVGTTCGITADNDAMCWEANGTGAIGDGTLTGSQAPQPVAGELKFVGISTGAVQSCGIADSGYAYCWGTGSRGELGVSTFFLGSRCGADRDPCSRTPLRVSGWRRFSGMSAGEGNHACARTLGGNIYCWGAGGLGQRGDGRTSAGEWAPVKTRSPQRVTATVTEDTAPSQLNR